MSSAVIAIVKGGLGNQLFIYAAARALAVRIGWLITQCNHAIVTNSCFSWWDAWLGAPGRPRSIMVPRATGDPVCPAGNWTVLPNTLDGVANVL